MARCPVSYSRAVGSSSSSDTKTMMPATDANRSPKTVGEKNGLRIA